MIWQLHFLLKYERNVCLDFSTYSVKWSFKIMVVFYKLKSFPVASKTSFEPAHEIMVHIT